MSSHMKPTNTLWQQNELMRILSNRPGTIYQEASDEDKIAFRRWVHELLRSGEIMIEFAKSDGTLRTMRCTLSASLMPKPVAIAGADVVLRSRPKPRSHMQIVYDLDINEWRSFCYDRLKNITVVLGVG